MRQLQRFRKPIDFELHDKVWGWVMTNFDLNDRDFLFDDNGFPFSDYIENSLL